MKLRMFSMIFALLAIWIFFAATTHGAFLEPRNLSNLFRQMSVTGVLATGMVLVIVAGHIDLSVGSVVCFVGAVLAISHVNFELSAAASFALAILTGTLVGALQGALTSFGNIPSFIVTLGGMMAFRGASMWITQGNTIALPDDWVLELGNAYVPRLIGFFLTLVVSLIVVFAMLRDRHIKKKHEVPVAGRAVFIFKCALFVSLFFAINTVMNLYQGIPVPVIVMLGLVGVFYVLATRSVFGRHVYAMGGNLEAASLSGIPVKRKLLGVFILMGALTGVAGTILAARIGSASPDSGQLLELDAIASCVIGGTSLAGGKGNVLSALLGALVMESLNNGMSLSDMESFWQYIVKGVVLVTAVWIDARSNSRG